MGLDVFAGDSSLMLQNLTLGGKGCIDGPPLMAPEIWVEIYNAWKALIKMFLIGTIVKSL